MQGLSFVACVNKAAGIYRAIQSVSSCLRRCGAACVGCRRQGNTLDLASKPPESLLKSGITSSRLYPPLAVNPNIFTDSLWSQEDASNVYVVFQMPRLADKKMLEYWHCWYNVVGIFWKLMPDICCISLLRDSLETMWPYGVILGSVVIHGMFDSYTTGLVVYFKWERVCKLIWHVKQFSAPSHSYCANKVKFHKLDLLINQVVNKSQHVVDTHCSCHLQESECRPHGEHALLWL